MKLKGILTTIAVAASVGATPAVARPGIAAAGRALQGAHTHVAADPTACPTGTPTQTITVINQAHVRPWALAKVENAVVDQSMQLRAAWGTPCVQFEAGGWLLYLQIGGPDGAHGNHYGGPGVPTYGFVWTSGSPWPGWSYALSHEVIEMLVDPTTARGVWHDDEGMRLEVTDPVEAQTYPLDGVNVSDFVLPAWFAGATQTAICGIAGCSYSDPLPGSDAGAPYDEMSILSHPWDTTWGSPG